MIKQTCREAALWLINLGCSVFPLVPREKRPFAKLLPIDQETGKHSWNEFQHRIPTADEVNSWFDQEPDANLALVCGAVSGIVAIDVDGPQGHEWFLANMARPNLYQMTSNEHKFHAIYRHPGNGVRIPPSVKLVSDQIDVRGDGSYIVVSPSVHPSGAVYDMRALETWSGMDSLVPMPDIKLTKDADGNYQVGEMPEIADDDSALSATLSSGERNSGLTALCGRWYGKGLSTDEVVHLALAWNSTHCDPPLSQTEVETIAKSMSRTHSGNNPYQLNAGGLQTWIRDAVGEFRLTDIYRDLNLKKAGDISQVKNGIKDLLSRGVIERVGKVEGVFRKKNDKLEIIDIEAVDDNPIPFWLPCGLGNYCDIMPGNIVMVAGETNSGKTGFLFNILACNRDKHFRYLSSEMTPKELRTRIDKFGYPLSEWKTQVDFVQRSADYSDAIDPDGFNVVDYLEVYDDFSKIGAEIKKIFDRLRSGVAFIAVQKKKGEEFGRGGEFTLEKARLGISLFTHGRTSNGIFGSCKVTKCKNFRNSNPEGKEAFYQFIDGYYYVTDKIHEIPEYNSRLSYYSEKQRKNLINGIQEYCKNLSDNEENIFPEDYYGGL